MKRDKPTPSRLRLREIHGHVTVTPDTMTAWYVLDLQRWSFVTDEQCESLIWAYAQRLADLSGHECHMRVTSKPYGFKDWALRLYQASPDPLPGFADHLLSGQKHLRKSNLSDKMVFLGVDIRDRSTYSLFGSLLAGRTGTRTEVARIIDDAEVRSIDAAVGGVGMSARRATTPEIEWLIHRSVRLGMPDVVVSGDDTPWDTDDVHSFTSGVTYTYDRFGPTVAVTADYDGTTVTRHIAVMTMGRVSKVNIPETGREPWAQHTDTLPFPVEWSMRFRVRSGKAVADETNRKFLAIRDMIRQYARHDIEPPASLPHKAAHAVRIQDEVTEGHPVMAARVHGWFRLAVAGDTTEEALERVKAVRDAYGARYQFEVQHPRNLIDAAAQWGLYDEFTPGQPVTTTAYQRRVPVRWFAAGVPHVSARIGDNRGPHMGHTAGSVRRPFMHDPHYAIEEADASGLTVVVGGLGSGKSGLVTKAAYESTRRNITTTLLDPSGPMANLVKIPALANHARHIDLMGGQDGVLNPWAVIRDPLPGNYDTATEYEEARQNARQNRKMLATDVARMLLPPQVDALPGTALALSDAIREVGGARDASMWDVITRLDANDDQAAAKPVANQLRDMADMPMSRLFYANNHRDQDEITDTLLVLTLGGIQLPSAGTDPARWSTMERLGVPLLHLASHYTTARAYGIDRDLRKMVGLDEVGLVAEWASGKHLFNRLGRDSRKHNIAVWAASQGAREILGLDIANWVTTAYVGRTEDPDTAAEALRFLRIRTGVGYERVLANLSPHIAGADGRKKRGAREFLVKDADNNVEKVRIEIHDPDLLTAIQTTPTGRARGAQSVTDVPAWLSDPVPA